MEKNNYIYIDHIKDSLNKILEFTKGMDEKAFLNNELVKDAVTRNFEVIGEATKNIPENFRQNYPDVPWKKMAGMRDKLIHDYMGIDFWKVWETVVYDIPKLKAGLDKIINQRKKLHKK